eukprot:TRINITY_DN22627_c0_g1_i1.p1 TRINITY_DN22627_c0_g1~~TRINITY_DN22627_c0_g1_i1.p1  ORF type:complete len:609 (+),score=98.66 TRINITY_DN22627_c0_g1_i1:197-1828(+)
MSTLIHVSPVEKPTRRKSRTCVGSLCVVFVFVIIALTFGCHHARLFGGLSWKMLWDSHQFSRGFGVSSTPGAAVPVVVMLPLDSVVQRDGIAVVNDPTSLLAHLRQLKAAAPQLEGVLADVWWGLTEPEPGNYSFGAYRELFALVQQASLSVDVVFSFHSCGGNVGDTCNVPLPAWARAAAHSQGAMYTDREGHVDNEYISLGADHVAIFPGVGSNSSSPVSRRSAVAVYADWMRAFRGAFDDMLTGGGTAPPLIRRVEVGLGPAGELRYPAYPAAYWTFCGVGEFQCYDPLMLRNLSAAAAAAGRPEWGHGGPSNAGTYNSKPSDGPATFWHSGASANWRSDYGQFFLRWYSGMLLAHGEDVLAEAVVALRGTPAILSAKIAGIHWWQKAPHHAAELTAGYWVTEGSETSSPERGGVWAGGGFYDSAAAMLQRVGVSSFVFTCLEMRDSAQPAACDCGPEELVASTKTAAARYGRQFGGENALARFDDDAYKVIENASSSGGIGADGVIAFFAYLRLTPTLLQPDNLNRFVTFVRTMHGPSR